jgi:endonuclease YncB( thermonuclease family)
VLVREQLACSKSHARTVWRYHSENHRMPRLSSLLMLALLLVWAALPVSAAAAPHDPVPVRQSSTEPGQDVAVLVTAVGDGDSLTVQLPDGSIETLRLLGIDAPERTPEGRAAGCYAQEAAARAGELALGQTATLEFDTRQRDRAGRLLGYLWLDGHAESLNEQLLAEGMVLPLTVGPNSAYNDDLRAAARRAELGKRGIWAACDVADPPTVATEYPLDETQALGTDAPAVRLVVGTEREDTSRQLIVQVEARADAGLRGIVVSADRADDPAFSDVREIPCDGQTVCRAAWTARPRGLGTYHLTARALTADNQTADVIVGLRVVGRWQTIAAQAAEIRARAIASPPPRAEDAAAPAADGSCPATHPIKALQTDAGGGRRYVLPADDGYAAALTAICYTSEDATNAAGFRHAAP